MEMFWDCFCFYCVLENEIIVVVYIALFHLLKFLPFFICNIVFSNVAIWDNHVMSVCDSVVREIVIYDSPAPERFYWF